MDDCRRMSILKSAHRLPPMSDDSAIDDENTVTNTFTRNRRVSFGKKQIKGFLVGSTVNERALYEYEQFHSSDSSVLSESDNNPLDLVVSRNETSAAPVHIRSGTTPAENFAKDCINIAKSVLENSDMEMTAIIIGKKSCNQENLDVSLSGRKMLSADANKSRYDFLDHSHLEPLGIVRQPLAPLSATAPRFFNSGLAGEKAVDDMDSYEDEDMDLTLTGPDDLSPLMTENTATLFNKKSCEVKEDTFECESEDMSMETETFDKPNNNQPDKSLSQTSSPTMFRKKADVTADSSMDISMDMSLEPTRNFAAKDGSKNLWDILDENEENEEKTESGSPTIFLKKPQDFTDSEEEEDSSMELSSNQIKILMGSANNEVLTGDINQTLEVEDEIAGDSQAVKILENCEKNMEIVAEVEKNESQQIVEDRENNHWRQKEKANDLILRVQVESQGHQEFPQDEKKNSFEVQRDSVVKLDEREELETFSSPLKAIDCVVEAEVNKSLEFAGSGEKEGLLTEEIGEEIIVEIDKSQPEEFFEDKEGNISKEAREELILKIEKNQPEEFVEIEEEEDNPGEVRENLTIETEKNQPGEFVENEEENIPREAREELVVEIEKNQPREFIESKEENIPCEVREHLPIETEKSQPEKFVENEEEYIPGEAREHLPIETEKSQPEEFLEEKNISRQEKEDLVTENKPDELTESEENSPPEKEREELIVVVEGNTLEELVEDEEKIMLKKGEKQLVTKVDESTPKEFAENEEKIVSTEERGNLTAEEKKTEELTEDEEEKDLPRKAQEKLMIEESSKFDDFTENEGKNSLFPRSEEEESMVQFEGSAYHTFIRRIEENEQIPNTVIEAIQEQELEKGTLWKLEDKNDVLISINVLNSKMEIAFEVKNRKLRANTRHLVVKKMKEKELNVEELGFQILSNYINSQVARQPLVRDLPNLLDLINGFACHLQKTLKDLLKVATRHPAGRYKNRETILFKVISFPLRWCSNVSINLKEMPFLGSKNVVIEHLCETSDEKAIRRLFDEACNTEAPLERFVYLVEEWLVGLEKPLGKVTKRTKPFV